MRYNKINDFVDSFKNTTAKVVGNKKMLSQKTIAALGMAAVLSGCQMTPKYDIEGIDMNHEVPQYNQAVKIDGSNYKDILRNQISGVYQNMYDEGRVSTFYFPEDKNADKRIVADLDRMNIDDSSYHWQKKLMDISTFLETHDKQSRHVQDQFGYGTDINLSKIEKNNYGSDYMKGYYLLAHEDGHAFDHQQLSFTEYVEVGFDKEKLIRLEASSDMAAFTKTYQMAAEIDELHDFERFYESFRKTAKFANKQKKMDDVHQVLPVFAIFDDLKENNPNALLGLKGNEIRKLSEISSKLIIEHDYAKDYKKSIEQNVEKTELLSVVLKSAMKSYEEEPENFNSFYDEFNKTLDEAKTESQKKNAKSMLHVLKYVENNYEDLDYVRNNSELLTSYAVDLDFSFEMKGKEKLKINDYEVNRVLSSFDKMDTLVDSFKEHPEVKEILKNASDRYELNQSIASEYKTHNKASLDEDCNLINEKNDNKILEDICKDIKIESKQKNTNVKQENGKIQFKF